MSEERTSSPAAARARVWSAAVGTRPGRAGGWSMTAILAISLACSVRQEQTATDRLTGNLVTNGDFADRDRFWEVDSFSPWWKRPFERVSNHGEGGRLCVAVANASGAAMGWPPEAHPEDGFHLSAGARYRLSFVMTATVERWITAEAKIGMVAPPHEALLDERLVFTSAHQPFEFEFEAPRSARDAGVVFIIKAIGGAPEVTACIDDVKLEAVPAAMTSVQ